MGADMKQIITRNATAVTLTNGITVTIQVDPLPPGGVLIPGSWPQENSVVLLGYTVDLSGTTQLRLHNLAATIKTIAPNTKLGELLPPAPASRSRKAAVGRWLWST